MTFGPPVDGDDLNIRAGQQQGWQNEEVWFHFCSTRVAGMQSEIEVKCVCNTAWLISLHHALVTLLVIKLMES